MNPNIYQESNSKYSFGTYKLLNLHLNKNDRIYLVFGVVIFAIQFFLFKMMIPSTDIIDDSNNYIESAYKELSANLWPIGYSKFISFVHIFSNKDYFIVYSQFVFYTLSATLFFINFIKIVELNEWGKSFLIIILFINPAIISICNYVLSDIVFISISLIWWVALLKYITSKSLSIFILNVLITILLMLVKLQALYYPVILFLGIILSRCRIRLLLLKISLLIFSVVGFYCYEKAQVKKSFNVSSFSAFSGWQMANNALHAYCNVSVKERYLAKIPNDLAFLDNYVSPILPPSNLINGYPLEAVFIWDYRLPLQTFAMKNYKNAGGDLAFDYMAQYSELYNSYGLYLIKKYKKEYILYYVVPNMKQFFLPNNEHIGLHGNFRANDLSKRYIDFSNNEKYLFAFPFRFLSGYKYVMLLNSALFLILNIVFYFKRNRYSNESKNLILISVLFFFFTFLFSVLASPIVLRYQLFTIDVVAISNLMLMSLIIRKVQCLQRDV